ncbi:carbon-nitrogen hydrolase family protein [Thalassotalea psychrophila]|uniref:Carbon-nitrogen hydrolase family protein n=1 Tax=Thalassotalea psychrophila TaxID=3065647 RepID=A0ABY9TVQ4_9GAMM|nr:carbon-nitrogen hydrolase family protein [Colwelliaceae bacterium SQ149]
MARLTAIQLQSVPDIIENLACIETILSTLPESAEHLVVLPEACLYFGGKDAQQIEFAEPLGNGFMQKKLALLAVQYNVYLLAGTIPISSKQDDKFTASSLLFSPEGKLLNDYQKIHLFDVDVADNEKSYRESTLTQAGEKLSITTLPSFNVGMTVCYDLRFPELFRALTKQGADVICVPSAFTKVTGKAHWQALLQARAIENQVYIIAADQEGEHLNGRQTYGHSMIINPWGEIMTMKAEGVGYVSSNFDRELISKIRADIPVARHNKFSVKLNLT